MKYQIHKGSKYYGATTVFENIQFEIRNTEKIAIVGRNGCGKTTLLRVGGDLYRNVLLSQTHELCPSHGIKCP